MLIAGVVPQAYIRDEVNASRGAGPQRKRNQPCHHGGVADGVQVKDFAAAPTGGVNKAMEAMEALVEKDDIDKEKQAKAKAKAKAKARQKFLQDELRKIKDAVSEVIRRG